MLIVLKMFQDIIKKYCSFVFMSPYSLFLICLF